MENKFRIQSEKLFMTYPKCDIDKKDMLAFLKEKCQHWNYILVGQEKHQDGTPHLHAFVQMTKRKDILNARTFDLRGFHPCIEAAKTVFKSIEYCKKDKNFVEEGTAIEKTTGKKRPRLTNSELLHGDLVDMIQTDQLSLFSLAGVIKARELYSQLLVQPKPDLGDFFPSSWDGLELPVYPKTVKQRHYWLWSSIPNKGKSTFLKKIFDTYKASFISCQEKFQDIKHDDQVIMLDEFGKGNSLLITVINLMCDGTYKYPCKSKSAVTLNDPYILVCSNFSINYVYPNSNGRIEARFIEVCLDEYSFLNGDLTS